MPGGGGMGGMGMMDGTSTVAADELRAQSRALRKKAQKQLIGNNAEAGGAIINEAAALEQAEELLAKGKDDRDDKKPGEDRSRPAAAPETATVHREGPSVTYHLRARLTVPSRNDQQLIEVARIEMKPDYYYKAVPVLTSHVYRLADLVNRSEYVLLPGEATMYVGSDFVGRMNLPLVAIGERFTVGFGVDPAAPGRAAARQEAAQRAGRQPGPQLRVPDHGRQLQVRAGQDAGLGPPAPGRGRGGGRQPGRADAQAERRPDLCPQGAAGEPAALGPRRSSRARPARRRRRSPTSSSWSTPAT